MVRCPRGQAPWLRPGGHDVALWCTDRDRSRVRVGCGRATPSHRPGAPAMPFKINADRRDKIPRQRHRVTNWPASHGNTSVKHAWPGSAGGRRRRRPVLPVLVDGSVVQGGAPVLAGPLPTSHPAGPAVPTTVPRPGRGAPGGRRHSTRRRGRALPANGDAPLDRWAGPAGARGRPMPRLRRSARARLPRGRRPEWRTSTRRSAASARAPPP